MKAYIYNLFTWLLILGMFFMSGCNKEEQTSDFLLDVDTYIEKIVFDENFEGIIDNSEASITVNVPYDYDTKAMTVSQLVLSEGAEASIKENDKLNLNFSQNVRVTNGDAYFDYTVNVVHDAAEILYVGLADKVDALNVEEKEAVKWMLQNVTNSYYVSFSDIAKGRINLSTCKVIWWHLHIDGGIDKLEQFNEKASASIDALQEIKDYYNAGGNLLLTRYATFYAAKLGATLDGGVPNNCWYDSNKEIGANWNFSISGHTEHPLFQNLIMNPDESDKVYIYENACTIVDITTQWYIGADWGGYSDTNTWETNHGGKALGYDGTAINVWEYLPSEDKGTIVCIGFGCYNWSSDVDLTQDKYHSNVSKLTENALNYLKGE